MLPLMNHTGTDKKNRMYPPHNIRSFILPYAFFFMLQAKFEILHQQHMEFSLLCIINELETLHTYLQNSIFNQMKNSI